MNALLRATRHRLSTDDRGISIVEVLVAVTILAVTMTATAASVVQSLQITDDSRKSVIAANIAQFELERLRAIPFVDWVVDGTTGSTVAPATELRTGPNGLEYEVYQEPRWVSAGSDTDSCTARALGNTEDEDYVRVRQVVSFPNDPELTPIENITIIAPRLNFYDPFSGNLIVRVEDRDGGPQPGQQVEVEESSGGSLRTGVTDSTGCVFFPFLPAASGGTDYDVRLDGNGYIELESRVQAVNRVVNVAPLTTTPTSFTYDEGAEFDLVPVPHRQPTGCDWTVVTLGTQPGGQDDVSGVAIDPEVGSQPQATGIECRDTGGSRVPADGSLTFNNAGTAPLLVADFQPRIPHNVAYSVNSTGLLFPPEGVLTYPDFGQSAVPDSVASASSSEVCGVFDSGLNCLARSLFPYRTGFNAYAGRCPTADPESFGGARTGLTADPGASYQEQVAMVAVNLRTVQNNNSGISSVQNNRDVYADQQDDSTCPGGDRLYLGRTDGSGNLQALLPYGEWVLHWDNTGNQDPGDGSNMRAGGTPLSCADVVADENSLGNVIVRLVNLLLSPTDPDYIDSACLTVLEDGSGPPNVITGNPLVPYQIDVRRGDRVIP